MSKPSRREFLRRSLGAAGATSAAVTAGCSPSVHEPREGDISAEMVPLPPPGTEVKTTACDYCIVGCGYKAFVWPVGNAGTAEANALDAHFAEEGVPSPWVTKAMHSVVQSGGRQSHVLVVPDGASTTVNVAGDYSVRGGTLAQKLYREDGPTADRLKQPTLRFADGTVELSWDQALKLVAQLSSHTIAQYGESAWAMKMYSYQYYENTYALTKLALGAVKTPAWAVHDKPSEATDTPGINDAGINPFCASYDDWFKADVIFVSGVSLYDAKSILFQDWVKAGGAKLVVVNPRRDLTAAYAEQNGGLHLQLMPGTDTVLQNAIAREILAQGWEDTDFLSRRVGGADELAQESHFRRKKFGLTFAQYREDLFAEDAYTLDNAAAITGVPRELIAKAAKMLAQPVAGARPKTSVMLEKGNYWGHNYDNTASLASMGLLVGAGSGSGRVIARAGGHQRGMIKGASYPLDKSPDTFEGTHLPLNLDRWVSEGEVRMAWVIGTTWFAAMGASNELRARVEELVTGVLPRLKKAAVVRAGGVDMDAVVAHLKARMDAGGMVLVNQDIYPNAVSALADLILPASGWGEEDLSRMQGERRLRLYSKLVEPPGSAIPDWRIAAGVAQRMGFGGFDWKDSNAVFEEASERSEGSPHAYKALVELAHLRGQTGHEALRGLGTRGAQCPLSRDGDSLVETTRLHDDRFHTKSGQALFMRGSWQRVEPVQRELAPHGDELWITNIRVNGLWQSAFDDARIPFRGSRFPGNFLEIHPDDAAARDIENFDIIEVQNDAVPGHRGIAQKASFRAYAYITESVKQGVAASYFNYRGDVSQAANSVTSAKVDPVNQIYRFKLGKGRVVLVEKGNGAPPGAVSGNRNVV